MTKLYAMQQDRHHDDKLLTKDYHEYQYLLVYKLFPLNSSMFNNAQGGCTTCALGYFYYCQPITMITYPFLHHNVYSITAVRGFVGQV